MKLHVVYHQIDTIRWPSIPGGWRWCVQIAGRPDDPRLWLNAGWAPDEMSALSEGERNAATATRALRAAGRVDARFETVRLDNDPCRVDPIFLGV